MTNTQHDLIQALGITHVASTGYRVHTYNPRGRGYLWGCVGTLEGTRRRKQDVIACPVLALDDIGTKATAPALPPSAIIETSTGNYTYLYKLVPPAAPAQFEKIVKSAIDAGHCDPGAGGCERLFRLPESQPEGKEMSRLVGLWDREYDPASILDQMEVEEREVQIREYQPVKGRDVVDNVVAWLRDHDMIRGEMTGGWLVVDCPWAHLHTDTERQDGARYNPATDDDISRSFTCHHSHDHNTTDYLNWLREQGCDVNKVRQIHSLGGCEYADYSHSTNIDPAGLPDVVLTARGAVATTQKASPANVAWLLRRGEVRVRYNMMSHTQELEPGELFIRQIASDAGMSQDAVMNVVNLMDGERYHPMEEWLEQLEPWDGNDHFRDLAAAWPCDMPRTYVEMILRKWFIQVVQGVCGWRGEERQLPHVLVLVGPQHHGKTYWIKNLCPFTDEGGTLHLGQSTSGTRDSIRAATQAAIIELGELETTFRKSEVGELKNFLSRSSDTYRAAYARQEVKHRRTTSYAASVNLTQILRDATGSRRYWPLQVTGRPPAVPLQAWAQAHRAWKNGEDYFLSGQQHALLRDQQEDHRVITQVEDAIARAYPEGFYSKTHGGIHNDLDQLGIASVQDIIDKTGLKDTPDVRSQIDAIVTQKGGRFTQITHPQTKKRMKARTYYRLTPVENNVTHISNAPSAPGKVH